MNKLIKEKIDILATSRAFFLQSFPTNDNIQLHHNFESYKKEPIASKYLISFLSEVLGESKNSFQNAVSVSVVELDMLAINIDDIIDFYSKGINVEDVKEKNNVANRIVDAMHSMRRYKGFDKLVQDTFEYVDKSFEYNTSKREISYSLNKNDNDTSISTMLYLLPLVRYYSDAINPAYTKTIEKLFCLISNFVQITDDFKDFLEDLSINTATPLTYRFKELSDNNWISFKKAPLKKLAEEVIVKLNSILTQIEFELQGLGYKNHSKSYIMEVRSFQDYLTDLINDSGETEFDLKKIIKKIKYRMPIILCYTN